MQPPRWSSLASPKGSREKSPACLALCLQPSDKTQVLLTQFEGETDAIDTGGGANAYKGWSH